MTDPDVERMLTGTQFMTEKTGGSDVGNIELTARPDGDRWRLWGEKWFCSHADADVALLLARPEGAPGGTKGLALFAMPRTLDDGRRNAYRIVRLKDKLGTRSMASGEIKLEGASAYAVGKLDRGFVQMAEMVNWSRLSNGVKSTALMRRALHDALTVAHGRRAFGRKIVELPLARRQLLKLMVPLEQALSMSFITADALDRAEIGGSQEAAALVRMLTPVLKYRSTRDARKMTGDALEFRGGIGYVEEFACARLLRDAHLGSIWEGTGNIVALDALTRAVGRHSAEAALAADLAARLDESGGVPVPFRDRLRRNVDAAIGFAQGVAREAGTEADARRATSVLYHVASAVYLAWEADRIDQHRGDARRLLLSRLVLDHRLAARDPFALEAGRGEDRIADLLLGDTPSPMSTVAELVAA
jgi:alkylation response protein AidB-like acyl-CoA dehydrogenase